MKLEYLLMILLLGVLIFVVSYYLAKKRKEIKKPNRIISTFEREMVTVDGHELERILLYLPSESIWKCPNCGSENQNADNRCCVCGIIQK